MNIRDPQVDMFNATYTPDGLRQVAHRHADSGLRQIQRFGGSSQGAVMRNGQKNFTRL